ncbi:hypothetical protein JT05_10950 [Desulfosporosinus sp. Tol-M]|nr:hypothetical protein JT05_10950 [Desulfosporosinus sp. Tol-M]
MKLLTPIKIGNLEVRNRVVMPSITNNYAKDGYVTQQMLDYYEARARGGVGMICVEDGIVDFPIGNNTKNPVSIDDDKYIPMLTKLSTVIKKHGARAAIQISHAGRRAGRVSPENGCMEVTRGIIPVGPSIIGHPFPGYVVPRELRIEEIEDIVEKFGQAARRAIEAGFEIVGLHCAHMYLCGEFLSPWANKRTDKYGGSLENRLRFTLEIIQRMKKEMGNVPLICRMNGEEPVGGNTLLEIREIARRLQSAGIEAISVSTGFGAVLTERDFISAEAPIGTPEGCIVHLAENIKIGTTIPVMAGNMIRTPEFAENVLLENRADMITIGRPLITDPDWVNKVSAGKNRDIRPCVSCCQGCLGYLTRDLPITCIMNPVTGREGDHSMQPVPAERAKKVLVIGGGPGGLETAIIAARRGHKVTIWEKAQQLGGTVLLAELPPRKAELKKITNYFRHTVSQLKIDVELGKEANKELIKEFNPDAVVLAIGGKGILPPIKGITQNNVFLANDILKNNITLSGKVVIIGGGQVGVELAELLGEKGVSVTVVEALPSVAEGVFFGIKVPLMFKLEDYKVRLLTNTLAKEIKANGLLIERNGTEEFIEASSIVIAVGQTAQNSLEDELKEFVPELHAVGDCLKPGNIMDAVHEGYKVGLII